jgi:AMP deaminase
MVCASNFQLAFAALVGAAITAAAGYCLHCRYITRLGGDLASSAASHLRRQPRAPAPAPAPAPAGAPPRRTGAGSASLPDLSAFYDGSRAGSASLPDISALYDASRAGPAAGGHLAEEDDAGVVGSHASCALDADALLQIPQGLPRLQLVPDGMFARI